MRVSSENERQSTDLQKDALLKAGCDERFLFTDKMSGTSSKRPGLEQALNFINKGDCLVVWKLDRLGRSLPHLLDIVAVLQQRGIAFRSLTEQMDTNTSHGEFIFGLFGSLAQYERALIKERVIAGLEAAKQRGRKGGRPKVVSQEKKNSILKALETGETKAAICRNFSIKRSTLYDALSRRSIP